MKTVTAGEVQALFTDPLGKSSPHVSQTQTPPVRGGLKPKPLALSLVAKSPAG
jgi:hypothetical protein